MEDIATILEINDEGVKLKIGDEVFFLDYVNNPWFGNVSSDDISKFTYNSRTEHLHWPTLDVDLCVDGLRHPEKYPLKMYK